MHVTPLPDRLFVQRLDESPDSRAGVIVMPDSAKEKPQYGTVIMKEDDVLAQASADSGGGGS